MERHGRLATGDINEFEDNAGHTFRLSSLIGRDFEAGVYDCMVLKNPPGYEPGKGIEVVIEDREDMAVMAW